MAILNSIQRLMNGYGNGTAYVTASAVAISTTTVTTVVLATANPLLTQGYSNGLIRVKVYNGGGANTTATVSVAVTDGTSTVFVLPVTAAAAVPSTTPASGVDLIIDVNVDIAITTVVITVVAGGTTTTASMDYEIDLNP